jgi:hypothetical protein
MDLKQMFYRLSVSPYFNVKSRYLYHASIIASLNYQTMLSPVDLCDKIDELTYYIYRRNSLLAHNIVVSPLMLEVLCFRARVHSLHSKVRDAEVQQGQQGQDRQGQLGGLLSLLSERAERGDQVRGKTPILHANRPASGNLNTGCDFEARLLPIDLNMGKVGLGDAKFCCKLGDAYLLSFAVFSEGVTCADGHAILYDHFHLHVKQHDE